MKKILLFLIIFTILIPTASFAETDIAEETSKYIYETVSRPKVGSVGGEWSVLGLARGKYPIPDEYFKKYYETVEKYVREKKGNLHERKYTEYSRLIITLTAIGKSPENIAGYNLLVPLGDYGKTVWQGINGAVWALIALDCGGYEIPYNPTADVQATRDMYIDYILENQLPVGGWAMEGTYPDANITGMVLQALSNYQELEKVKNAIEKALAISHKLVYNDSESYVQMIVAYCSLGIEPPFKIPSEYRIGRGFKHLITDTDINLMATEQCLYALIAEERFRNHQPWLYDMKDVKPISDFDKKENLPVIYPLKSFDDCTSHTEKTAIEALAERGIINGLSDKIFSPDTTMTRAEFAATTVRGLGITICGENVFGDVSINDWFYAPVNSAYQAGIIKGISKSEFNPYGTVTKEEAAVMTARSAEILGINTHMEEFAIINTLCVFSDYKEVSSWASEALGFCIHSGIIPGDGMTINPKTPVTRAEIAHMIYNVLIDGGLINE